ncbi:btk-binding protein-related [Anaeramoeba flamelloides]|uniref:Btk-binding protein-related n=1 Tax=Anaeramoeba flamelloides TaxID=1746091 RepID=A0AAV8A9I6_9EUKA|nr:btk-binding protein-related [Anaeramoeba flamelloides]
MQTKKSAWGWGKNYEKMILKDSTPKLVTPTLLDVQNIKLICSRSDHTLFLFEDGKLIERGKQTEIIHQIPEGVEITQIVSSYYHFLLLGSKGELFGLGDGGSGRFGTKSNTSLKSITRLKHGVSGKIISVQAGVMQSYFLYENGDLYSSGYNSTEGKCGNNSTATVMTPVCIERNVNKVFCGPYGYTFFCVKDNKILLGCGNNTKGQLAIDSMDKNQKKLVNIKFDSPENIVDIRTGYSHSLLLDTFGQVFGSGEHKSLGIKGSGNYQKFEKLDFKNNFITQISCGCHQNLALTTSQEVYVFGSGNNDSDLGIKGLSFTEPVKVKLDPLSCGSLNIHCGSFSTFVWETDNLSMGNDLIEFYKSKKFGDCKIDIFPVNKIFIEKRTGKTIKEIQKYLETQSTQDEINIFLEWVYSGWVSKKSVIETICRGLGIENYLQKSLKDDILALYKDEDSKDFTILVKIDDDDYEEEEEEEEEFEEIPVHKFLLAARCGLFREMFQNVNTVSNSVKDFSGKSIDTIEVFIKYLYTGMIELTADNDPEEIVEELADAGEYYQLTNVSGIESQLQLIKKNLL